MVFRFLSLPHELQLMVVTHLPQAARARLMFVCRAILPIARLALFEDPEIITLACTSPQAWLAVPQPCMRIITKYLWAVNGAVINPQSLTLRTDLSRAELGMHNVLNLNTLPATDPLAIDAQHIGNTVRSISPTPSPWGPQPDWLSQLFLSDYDAYTAATIILWGPHVQELHFESLTPTEFATDALAFVTQDLAANAAHHAQLPNRPLGSLRLLQITVKLEREPRSFRYLGELSHLPNLREVSVAYGVPSFTSPHLFLSTLKLTSWACRHSLNAPLNMLGQLPVPGNQLPSATHPHLIAHLALTTTIGNLPNLQILEITDGRTCNWLLTGYHFFDTSNNNVMTSILGLPVVLRQSCHRLQSFKMLDRMYPGGRNGIWQYRWFFNSFGDWTGYGDLEHMELEAWYFFQGRPPAALAPIRNNNHPIPGQSNLPPKIKTVRITHLVEGYLEQSYHFLKRVWDEKVARKSLPELTRISFSTLLTGEVFPPPDPAGEHRESWEDLKALMVAAGITVVME